ncbi:hypothetical protein DI09_53p10, partial [Mitosporidium daphniae]
MLGLAFFDAIKVSFSLAYLVKLTAFYYPWLYVHDVTLRRREITDQSPMKILSLESLVSIFPVALFLIRIGQWWGENGHAKAKVICQSKFNFDNFKPTIYIQNSSYKKPDKKDHHRNIYMAKPPACLPSASPMLISPILNGNTCKKRTKNPTKPRQGSQLHAPKKSQSISLPSSPSPSRSSFNNLYPKPKVFLQDFSKDCTTIPIYSNPKLDKANLPYFDSHHAVNETKNTEEAKNPIVTPPSEFEFPTSPISFPAQVENICDFDDKKAQSASIKVSARPLDALEPDVWREPLPTISCSSTRTTPNGTTMCMEPVIRFRRSSWEGMASNNQHGNRFFQIYSVFTKNASKPTLPSSASTESIESGHRILIQHCKKCCPHNSNPARENIANSQKHQKIHSIFKVV